jgi:hypothetical protein
MRAHCTVAALLVLLLPVAPYAVEPPAATPNAYGWPNDLNEFFGCQLSEPTYNQIQTAMIDRLNRRSLAGVAPQEEYRTFSRFLKPLAKSLPRAALDKRLLNSMYRRLADFLTLEAEFSDTQKKATLNTLIELVTEYAEEHPGWNEDRTAIITQTIKHKRMFVPSTVLFGRYILPYRPSVLPSTTRVLRLPVEPVYDVQSHHVDAQFDLLTDIGPLYRIDFDTVGAATMLIEQSDDNRRYRSVLHKTTQQHGGLRAPMLIDEPFMTRYLRMRVTAPAEQAVLRTVQLFALKEAPIARSSATQDSLVVDGLFGETMWTTQPTAYGFVTEYGEAFAQHPTTVRVRHNDQTLYIAAILHNFHPQPTATGSTQRDAPLWEDESFEVRIKRGPNHLYRFIVNPNAVRFESLADDPGWNGEWTAAAANTSEGWQAEIGISFATLGNTPQPGARWNVNFVRTHADKTTESSFWAYAPRGEVESEAFGTLVFE